MFDTACTLPAEEPAVSSFNDPPPWTPAMQTAENRLPRGCLLQALRRYMTVVRDMEQTVLLPSMLRDVESYSEEDCFQDCISAAESPSKDLYNFYLMLKSIRNTVESGMMPPDDCSTKIQTHLALNKTLESLMEAEPEALFHFHLRGLFSIMANLTQKSQCLTTKYMDIIGIMN